MNPLRPYRAELHVHTVLSPCAEVEMIPPLIIQEALDRGIEIIAITDHNATANIPAVIKAAEGTGVHILPGMELQTREEVHLLCLFDTLEQIETFQRLVDSTLPSLANRPDFFGEQFIVDETGDFIRREDRLLIASSTLSIMEACDLVEKMDGLLIPAHVDRKAFGLLPTLGFIPEELKNHRVMEISRHITTENALENYPFLKDRILIQGGDVHRLDEFLGVNHFKIEKPSISEIVKAFNKIDGRFFNLDQPNL